MGRAALSDINCVTLSGRVTRDAEARVVGSTYACSFGLAVGDYRRGATDAQGNVTNEYTNFVDCTVLGDRAERLAPHIARGRQVMVRGRLHWRCWESEGQRRSKLDVTVDDIVFGAPPKAQAARQEAPAPAPAAGIYDDEIPF